MFALEPPHGVKSLGTFASVHAAGADVAWKFKGGNSAGGDDSGGAHGAMVVVAMVLLAMHIFMAVLNPATRPALAGMVFGRVRRSWAAKHHGGWLRDLDR